MKHPRGFTLIELLVALSVLGVLAALVLAALSSASKRSRDARRISDVGQIHKALKQYQDDYGYVPAPPSYGESEATWWDTSTVGDFIPFLRPYLTTIPADPRSSATGGSYADPAFRAYGYFCWNAPLVGYGRPRPAGTASVVARLEVMRPQTGWDTSPTYMGDFYFDPAFEEGYTCRP